MITKAFIIALLGIATYAVIALPRGLANLREAQTRHRIRVLATALDAYYSSAGSLPHPIDNRSLVAGLKQRGVFNPARHETNANGEFLDAWGTPIRVTMTERGATIASAGPDRTLGTADDVGSRDK